MSFNTKLIETFYRAFQQKDYKTMQDCYADNATFSDPVFKELNAIQVSAMWQMLLTRATDLKVEYANILANEHNGNAEWIAKYTFSGTGNTVVNHVKASFVFKEGKIVQHIDVFNFYKWASQALGIKGKLLGWTTFLQQKVSTQALKNLERFMQK